MICFLNLNIDEGNFTEVIFNENDPILRAIYKYEQHSQYINEYDPILRAIYKYEQTPQYINENDPILSAIYKYEQTPILLKSRRW